MFTHPDWTDAASAGASLRPVGEAAKRGGYDARAGRDLPGYRSTSHGFEPREEFV
jgi:hypothetical protein